VIPADWAATAVQNARRYRNSERRRIERERTAVGSTATQEPAVAAGGETGLERVLELIVDRGRVLIDIRSAEESNSLTDGDEQLLRAFAASAATAVALARAWSPTACET
jgi:two-component system, NarL family, sensor histidine kinase DevS